MGSYLCSADIHWQCNMSMMHFMRLALATAIICAANSIKVGDKLPSVEVHSGFPPEKINLAKYTANKAVLIVGLPGAFTPT